MRFAADGQSEDMAMQNGLPSGCGKRYSTVHLRIDDETGTVYLTDYKVTSRWIKKIIISKNMKGLKLDENSKGQTDSDGCRFCRFSA